MQIDQQSAKKYSHKRVFSFSNQELLKYNVTCFYCNSQENRLLDVGCNHKICIECAQKRIGPKFKYEIFSCDECGTVCFLNLEKHKKNENKSKQIQKQQSISNVSTESTDPIKNQCFYSSQKKLQNKNLIYEINELETKRSLNEIIITNLEQINKITSVQELNIEKKISYNDQYIQKICNRKKQKIFAGNKLVKKDLKIQVENKIEKQVQFFQTYFDDLIESLSDLKLKFVNKLKETKNQVQNLFVINKKIDTNQENLQFDNLNVKLKKADQKFNKFLQKMNFYNERICGEIFQELKQNFKPQTSFKKSKNNFQTIKKNFIEKQHKNKVVSDFFEIFN